MVCDWVPVTPIDMSNRAKKLELRRSNRSRHSRSLRENTLKETEIAMLWAIELGDELERSL